MYKNLIRNYNINNLDKNIFLLFLQKKLLKYFLYKKLILKPKIHLVKKYKYVIKLLILKKFIN